MIDYVFSLLRLEQQLEAYRRVHQEELDEIRRALVELRNQILLVGNTSSSPIEIHPLNAPDEVK